MAVHARVKKKAIVREFMMESYHNDHDIAPAPGRALDVAAEFEAAISRVSS
jgi:hypothetical protein